MTCEKSKRLRKPDLGNDVLQMVATQEPDRRRIELLRSLRRPALEPATHISACLALPKWSCRPISVMVVWLAPLDRTLPGIYFPMLYLGETVGRFPSQQLIQSKKNRLDRRFFYNLGGGAAASTKHHQLGVFLLAKATDNIHGKMPN